MRGCHVHLHSLYTAQRHTALARALCASCVPSSGRPPAGRRGICFFAQNAIHCAHPEEVLLNSVSPERGRVFRSHQATCSSNRHVTNQPQSSWLKTIRYDGSWLWALGLDRMVLAWGLTHSCDQRTAGSRVLALPLGPHVCPLRRMLEPRGLLRRLSPRSLPTGLARGTPQPAGLAVVGPVTWGFWAPRTTLPRDGKWKPPARAGTVLGSQTRPPAARTEEGFVGPSRTPHRTT